MPTNSTNKYVNARKHGESLALTPSTVAVSRQLGGDIRSSSSPDIARFTWQLHGYRHARTNLVRAGVAEHAVGRSHPVRGNRDEHCSGCMRRLRVAFRALRTQPRVGQLHLPKRLDALSPSTAVCDQQRRRRPRFSPCTPTSRCEHHEIQTPSKGPPLPLRSTRYLRALV